MSTALRREPPEEPEATELMDDRIVRLEVATETMSAYIGYLTNQIHSEQDQPKPDQQKINALKAEKSVVLKERKTIRPDSDEVIAKAIYIYGPIMKALFA
jgi:hypothetical protein